VRTMRTNRKVTVPLLAALLGIVMIFGGLTPNSSYNALALPQSVNVAYITDASGSSFRFINGSNVWDNAANIDSNATTNCNPSHTSPCTYITNSGNSMVFSDLDVGTIDSLGVSTLAGKDTAFLYQVCDFGSHPGLASALNTYLNNGGKVVIYDGDWCAPGIGGQANYTSFLFPFSTNSPGPQGSAQSLTFVEPESPPATITRNIAVGDGDGFDDAVGDSNTFVTFDPAWCTALKGPNANGVVGAQVAYARTAAGGLVIYDGQDNAISFGPTVYLNKVFDNVMDQPFNPDSLPCVQVATGITLSPATASNPAGTTHTVTASVTNATGPAAGVTVTFNVISGPNAGQTGTGITGASGDATFTYSDTGGAGTDSIQASFTDNAGAVHQSNTVSKIWQAAGLIITLGPVAATNPVSGSHTVTATVLNGTAPLAGVTVTFNVISGPNAGQTGTGITNATGQATFTYSDTGGAGTDQIRASFVGADDITHESNIVIKVWTPPVQVVGGEIMGIDMTSLMVAGIFANATWMVATIVGTAAVLTAIGFSMRNKSK